MCKDKTYKIISIDPGLSNIAYACSIFYPETGKLEVHRTGTIHATKLVKKKEGNTIYKTRDQLLADGEIVAIDIFEGDLSGLAYMEIEFANMDEALAYETPDWVIKDVTDDVNYKNGHLARFGIPQE